jgi:GTP-binding protein
MTIAWAAAVARAEALCKLGFDLGWQVGEFPRMKFVDEIRVHAKAGDGGNGCCSFRREKFVPRGGPDGGDGGRGGDIVLVADHDVDSLVALFFEPLIRSKRGSHGKGKDKQGRSAEPNRLKVPMGTVIYRAGQSQRDDVEEEPIADLSAAGQEFLLCKGGDGGKGNTHFKSSTNRVPRQVTKGYPGEEGWFMMELRTIADIGLVGYPNAGKSTLLRALSAAKPKTASYPFTTLHPLVGVVELAEYGRATVADIPGLIEGAHENRGLGHEFLRHIVRCKSLFFVLDMAGSEGRSPVDDYQSLRKELRLYDPTLTAKPACVIANKMDLPEAEENLRVFKTRFPKLKVLSVCAEIGEGMDKVFQYIGKKVAV